ncbi:hypothetical protein L202_00481 [Cryptococcus amylolentus CBS 6039]|uniref:Uncharacterized protein n=1 Tax=Cryptococcus amylolentus CBS 6039 TaxID=1295533 RepID=A0A1E3I766_9TREE|nr:hypothetical protein L202_00481 [Cryptococcus amylolentus CBS 6039]ODN84553.1 hypothetical protein L202_00481 [Cryptococcus amylolentus CBS 6039]
MDTPRAPDILRYDPDLPLDVLCNVVALVPPPFYAAPPPLEPSPTPPNELIANLDPSPHPAQTDGQCISALTRASSCLLEAARPWLWEHVDVKGGRGWLAIVNALTEEVIEQDVEQLTPLGGSVGGGSDGTGSGGQTPVTGPEALRHPGAIAAQSMQAYASPPSSATMPFPVNSSAGPMMASGFSSSPPQPSHIHQLLTPPTSRTSSPAPGQQPNSPAVSVSGSGSDRAEHSPSPGPSSISSATRTKLRGRSRSPRRTVGFETQGIHAVLERSRSASDGSQRPPGGNTRGFLHRRTSLSRSRTWHDSPGDDEEEEEDDEIMPLVTPPVKPPKTGVITPRVTPEDRENANPELLPPPGPYIRHLSFTNFRTIGARRSQEEAVKYRFVTAGRLEGVIKNAPNLVTLCMTEYVDSSLAYPVLEEIFFRGSRKPRYHSPTINRARSLSIGPTPSVASTTHDQLDPPRPEYVPYEDETEDQKWKRRELFTPLEALDLTGCVSVNFTQGMQKFYDTWLALDDESDDEEEERGRGRWKGSRRGRTGHSPDATEDESDHHSHSVSRDRHGERHNYRRPPRFRHMRRLCLRMCTSLDSQIVASLVWSFPCLTHLDLSNTKVPDELLSHLTDHCPRSFRLTSLSLARCPKLNSYAVADFLCRSPAVRDLVDLNLYVNPTQGNALESDALMRLITEAPCMRTGRLRYLDLSSAKFTPAHLAADVFPYQPSLVSLGLSHVPTLALPPIADFLLNVAPNVEILTLVGTATTSSLDPSRSSLQITLELHARLINPLTTLPFSLASLYLTPGSSATDYNPGPTRLRVVELMGPIRRSIAPDGKGEWKVIKSKGGRGWYVDVSAGWRPVPRMPASPTSETGFEQASSNETEMEMQFVRHLPKGTEHRDWLTKLSDATGRVGSTIGWHAKKMEVVRGFGMMGREEGMAGAGAFAFEE